MSGSRHLGSLDKVTDLVLPAARPQVAVVALAESQQQTRAATEVLAKIWTQDSVLPLTPELTWALAYEHWGKGYATEAAAAVRDWFGRAGLISLIAPDNARSQRVAERLGATTGETVELPGYGPHVVWMHPE